MMMRYHKLRALYETVRRKALDVDSVIDEILGSPNDENIPL
jgi:hypothetical protein